MNPQPYLELSPAKLLSLAIWREAQNQPFVGKCGVGHVIMNRATHGGWWGSSVVGVILCPWQISSFNRSDPNSTKWPNDLDPSWADSQKAAEQVFSGETDPTDGATYYHDISMGWPIAWGSQCDYTQTLAVGRLLFYRPNPPNNHEQVQEAATGES